MGSERIDEIIGLILSKEASNEEIRIFEKWLDHSEENRRIFQTLKVEWEINRPSFKIINADELKNRIWDHTVGERKKGEKHIGYQRSRLNFPFYLKIAAIVIVFISITGLIIKEINNGPVREAMEVWVQKSNPPGQKSKVFLPDGSEAWLNAGSKLRYCEKFTDSSRIIYLKGEAFFEVVKDPTRPFIVVSNDVSITALGTTFNVNGSDEDVKVALVAGKVKIVHVSSANADIHEVLLEPGQAALFDKNKKDFTLDEFDVDAVIGWKDGILHFKDAPFKEVVEKLELWYDVHISLNGNGTITKHYNGKFKNENLRNVLESMSFVLGFNFKLEDKNVVIHVN